MPRTSYKTIKVKVPKLYAIGSPDKDGNHEILTRSWYRHVTKTDEFWADFLERVPKGVLAARFPVTINATLVADTAKALEEKLEKQVTRSVVENSIPTAGLLVNMPAVSPGDVRTSIVKSKCSICGAHIDDGQVCLACIAAADDNDGISQLGIGKRKASEPEEDTTVVVQIPTVKRESSPVVKYEDFEGKKFIPIYVDQIEQGDADFSYLSSRRIGYGRRAKRAKPDVTFEGEETVAEAGDGPSALA